MRRTAERAGADAQARPHFMRRLADAEAAPADLDAPAQPIRSSTDLSPAHLVGRSFLSGNFEFVRPLSVGVCSWNRALAQLRDLPTDELRLRLSRVDLEMDQEIDELSRKYRTKKQPILDALDLKKQRMTTNF